MKGLRRFLAYLKPYKKNFAGFSILMVLSIVFGTISLTLVIPFLQIIFDKAVLPTTPPVFDGTLQSLLDTLYYHFGKSTRSTDKKDLLLFLCAGIVLMFFLKNINTYLASHVLAPIRTGVIRDLRKKMYQNITRLPLGYYSEQRKGDIMTKMSADVLELEWSIVNSFISLVRDPLQIILTVAILFFFSPKLTLFVLLMLPISILLISTLGRSLKKSTFKGQKFLSDLMVVIEETLGGIKVMKTFTAEKYLTRKFNYHNDNFVKQGTAIFRKRSASSPLSEFLASIIIACVIWYGGNLVLGGSMAAELFITYIAMFSQIISPAKSFSNAFYNAKTGGVMLDRIESIINEPNPIQDHPGAEVKKEFTHAIEFKNVSFQYEVKPVLENISLYIPKGKTIALVGQSGAGKSTMADLMPRFYDVNNGAILLDGKDIRDITLPSLRSLIGIVPQQSILFNDTVLNNIAFGDENPDEAKAIAAAQMANAHDFIMEMGEGYQSMVGEQGGKLSGGQKQRIAIARALYKNAPILILDEATSSLDNESEKLVQSALNNLMQDRTSIVIAHRLSTIQNADLIVVLENGIIAETGTHAELIQKDGVYKKLYELSITDIDKTVN